MQKAEHLPALRLRNTSLQAPLAPDAAALLRLLGPVQAQDEQHAKTALALRLPSGTVAAIDRAIAEGTIVRTWLMRGTLHFVAAADLHWVSGLIGQSLVRGWMSTFEKGGLSAATLSRGYALLRDILPGAGPRPRNELVACLEAEGIDMRGPFSSRIFTCAAYEGLLCLGPKAGAQDTFVWRDDWVAPSPIRTRDEAIAELAQRYFQSHGPASIDDFVNWSGVGLREARAALAAQQPAFGAAVLDGRSYHFASDDSAALVAERGIRFLPAFDEYLLGYKDRSHILDPAHSLRVVTSNGIFRPTVLVDGIVRGTWQRKQVRGHTLVEITWLGDAPALAPESIGAALARLSSVWETPLEYSIAPQS